MAFSGAPFQAAFSSSDASSPGTEAAARFSLYGAAGAGAITLAATDQVTITDLAVLVGATGRIITIYEGSDATADAGEIIWQGTLAANGGICWPMKVPFICSSGCYPKARASGAGQVDCHLRGYIRKAI